MNKRQAQKQATRKRIREVAKQLFAEQGFEATTSRQIAQQADVAVGTLFVHFANKQTILADILFEDIEVVVQTAVAGLQADAPTSDQLLHLARVLYTYYLQHVELSRELLRFSLLQPQDEHDFNDQIGAFLGLLRGLFAQGQASGHVSTIKAVDPMANAFMSAYFFVLISLLREPEPNLPLALSRLAQIIDVIVG